MNTKTGQDARFEDVRSASDRPVRLRAEDANDLEVISTLLQDAVGKAGDIRWMPKRKRLVLILNRFRWEDVAAAERQKREYERVQSALTIEGVERVQARGLSPDDPEMIFALLSASFEAGEAPAGRVVLSIAGDGDIAAEVEFLEVSLMDLSRPWRAGHLSPPSHADD